MLVSIGLKSVWCAKENEFAAGRVCSTVQANVLCRLSFLCVLYIGLHQVGFVKSHGLSGGVGFPAATEHAQLACCTVEKHSFRVYGYGPVEFFI